MLLVADCMVFRGLVCKCRPHVGHAAPPSSPWTMSWAERGYKAGRKNRNSKKVAVEIPLSGTGHSVWIETIQIEVSDSRLVSPAMITSPRVGHC